MVSSAIPVNAFEPSVALPNGNHTPLSKTATKESIHSTEDNHNALPKHIPTLTAVMPDAPKSYKDILAYEDKWIGWDGPVWCARYGRFEDADDAAKDDGFESAGQVHHQGKFRNIVSSIDMSPLQWRTLKIPPRIDLGPHHKHNEQCTCRAPLEPHSYAKDISRRVEPMVTSLVNLEHQVAKLFHHMGLGTHIIYEDDPNKDTEAVNQSHLKGNERFAMHDDGLSGVVTSQAGHKSKVLAKMEADIHALQHQMHELLKKDGATATFIRNT